VQPTISVADPERVMPGLVPGIHDLATKELATKEFVRKSGDKKDVDGRGKPGPDEPLLTTGIPG